MAVPQRDLQLLQMNPTSISQVRAVLSELGIRPSKRLGQSFMVDGNTRDIIVDLAEIDVADRVLEVGPGLGALTERLAPASARVVAVEKDRVLYEFLKRQYAEFCNVELVHADMLDCDVTGLCESGVNKVVSNLPYSVGTRILVDVVRSTVCPAMIVVTLQKEVADRLAANPGGRNYGILSVWAQLRYDVVVEREVSPNCFWPKPAVKSAMVVLRKHSDRDLPEDERRVLYELTKHVFAHRRKQLASALRDYAPFVDLALPGIRHVVRSVGIEERARPEDVSVEQWRALACAVSSGRVISAQKAVSR